MRFEKLTKLFLGFSFLGLGIASIGTKIEASEGTYYSSITNTTNGQTLASSLHSLISSGTKDLGYDGLWTAYKTTDLKANGKIWDMYSNYDFTPGDDQAGSYKKEGDAYNREHSIPQSWFNEASPMKADLYHVYPTDGYVNNRRSNYVYGEVGTDTYTSENGSKLGTSKLSGYSGTVFEPIDEYKGDFARTYFYMAIRYSDKVGNWTSDATKIFSGSYPYLTDYSIELFMAWSKLDPVSEKETNRVDNVYSLQKNRNPFIDHPEWIDVIWGSYYDGDYEHASTVDQTKVNNVISLISALPEASAVALTDETNINAANTAYYKLNTSERALVTNYTKLTQVIAALNTLKGSSSGTNTDESDIVDDGSCVTITKFTATSGNLNSFLSYSTSKGGAGKDPAIYSNAIRLYQGTSSTSGGEISITSTGDPITAISIGSSMATSVAYSIDSGSKSSAQSLSAGEKITLEDLSCQSITFYCLGTTSSDRFYVNYLKVYYVDDKEATDYFMEESTKASMKFDYVKSTEVTGTGEAGYSLVTSVSDLKDNDKIIIAATTSGYALGGAQASYRSNVAITIENNKISSLGSASVITLNKTSSGYTLLTDEGYLYHSGKNNLYTSESPTSGQYWNITFDSSGNALIVTSADATRKIMFNANSGTERFATYTSTQTAVQIYKKTSGETTTTSYSYSNMKIRFGGCISKDLYDELVALGGTFGVDFSLDSGENYTKSCPCTPARVNALGDSTASETGSYYQWFAVIPVGEENYSTVIYAKCYVLINGTKYYMGVSYYSIKSMASYYASNASSLGIDSDIVDMLGDLAK